jgi:hypothetical protein
LNFTKKIFSTILQTKEIVMNKKGFSFWIIPLVIALAAAGWFGYPMALGILADMDISQAEADVKMLVKKVQRYQTVEASIPENLLDLKAKYLPTIDTLVDPWKNPYQIDKEEECIFSYGPDGKHSAEEDKTWDDDIFAFYVEKEEVTETE